MFTIGQIIGRRAKRLYVTTQNSQEIGMYRTGILSSVYYLTRDRVVIGVFTEYDEINNKLGEILGDIEIAELQCCLSNENQ